MDNSFDLVEKNIKVAKAQARTQARSNLIELMKKVKSNVYIISIDSDLLFTDYEQREIYKKISLVKKNVYYFQIRSDHGHDAFFIEYDQISSFLKRCFK